MIKKLRWTSCFFLLFSTIGSGWSADLKSPFELESSKILPRSVSNPRVKAINMAIESKFNGLGVAEPLGNRLNKKVTWADVLSSQSNEADRNLIRGVLQDPINNISDITEQGSPGNTLGEVNVHAQVNVPVIALGVSDRFTLAAAFPVYKAHISTATGFSKTDDGQKFIDAIAFTNPEKANEAKEKLNNGINEKLNRLGYETIRSETIEGLGDIKIVGKTLVYQNPARSISLKTELTIPSGRKPNPDKAIDVPTGDGQWDVGGMIVYDEYFWNQLRWNNYAGYTVQLSDQVEKRLPISANDSLSSDKELLKRNLGDIASLGTSFTYEFISTGLSIGSGYSFQYQLPTLYTDGKFPSYRYRLLESESPLQALHSATVMAGFSTVEFFRQKKFFYPFQANIAYSRPLLGRSVTTNSVIAAELVLFF